MTFSKEANKDFVFFFWGIHFSFILTFSCCYFFLSFSKVFIPLEEFCFLFVIESHFDSITDLDLRNVIDDELVVAARRRETRFLALAWRNGDSVLTEITGEK